MNSDSRIVEIELEKIVPNRFQPRKTFNEDISELAESIRAHGILQPITVRPLGEKFEIIMGERRYRACEKLGLHKIPAMVVNMNDREAMEVALIENLQRQDLNPIEEALSYKRILDTGYTTQEQLAQRIGKTQSTIANKLRLLSLEKEVQSALLKNQISERHARSLLRLNDRNAQIKLLEKIISEKLTVKKTDEEINRIESNNNDATDDNLAKADSIEIIDFDDNPFNQPDDSLGTSNLDENNFENQITIDDYSRYNENNDLDLSINNFDQELDHNYQDTKMQMGPKNKPIIPTKGIVDDFDNQDNLIVVETNHGFNDAKNGSGEINVAEDDLDVNLDSEKESIEPDTISENVELTNVEPDSIEISDTNDISEISSNNKSNDFDKVKAIIEKCQSELNGLGYNVRLEKYDFEKMAQFILKVDKK